MNLLNRTAAVLCAVMASALPAAMAQELPGPCSLLTRGEVGAAVGDQLKMSFEGDTTVPTGPSKGQIMSLCSWPTSAQDAVTLSITRARQDQPETKAEQFAEFQRRGWAADRRDFGNTACFRVTAPPDRPNRLSITNCRGEAKGFQIILQSSRTGEPIAFEAINGLFDKAIARLP